MKYELLVDGRREAQVDGEDAVRAWIGGYRAERAESDPDATHVQVRALPRLAWLTGGSLVPRERFLA
ncbi:MAG: hypothetical protein JOY73_02960 [Actinobacteria bacterium]|nr:hypothetical protein [Actinomycetota bacterium]